LVKGEKLIGNLCNLPNTSDKLEVQLNKVGIKSAEKLKEFYNTVK